MAIVSKFRMPLYYRIEVANSARREAFRIVRNFSTFRWISAKHAFAWNTAEPKVDSSGFVFHWQPVEALPSKNHRRGSGSFTLLAWLENTVAENLEIPLTYFIPGEAMILAAAFGYFKRS